MAKAFLVVRICGQPDVPYWATTTMSLLKLEKKYRATNEINEDKIPKIKAWFFVIFPVGIGLRQVLVIIESKSDSYHIFKVPAAPAPNATAIKDKIEFKKLTLNYSNMILTFHLLCQFLIYAHREILLTSNFPLYI